MVIHQLEIARRAKKDTDDERVVELLRGRTSLREALGVSEETLASYRRQAEVLFRAADYRKCADVVEGLVALDAVGVAEATLLVRAYEQLGEHDKACAIGQVLSAVLSDMEARAPSMEVTR